MYKHDRYTPTDFKILDFRIQDNIPIRDGSSTGTVLEWRVKLNSEGNTEEEIFEGNWSPPQAMNLLAHWKKIKNSKKTSKNHDSFYTDHWIFYQKLQKAARKSMVASLMLVLELEKAMSEEELKFASESEALQHLANLTGKRIKVAVSFSKLQRQYDNMTPDDGANLDDIFSSEVDEVDRELKHAKQETLNLLSSKGISDVKIIISDFDDYTLEEESKYVWKSVLNIELTIKGDDLDRADKALGILNTEDPGDGVAKVFSDYLDLEDYDGNPDDGFESFKESSPTEITYTLYFHFVHDGSGY